MRSPLSDRHIEIIKPSLCSQHTYSAYVLLVTMMCASASSKLKSEHVSLTVLLLWSALPSWVIV